MKYQYVTLSTGHVMRGDSDVDLHPAAVPVVMGLLRRGRGEVPYTSGRIRYRFDDVPGTGSAALTVSTTCEGLEAPIWTSIFYLDERAAMEAHEQLFRMAASLAVPQKTFPGLSAPGLATLRLPGASMIGPEDTVMLADFGKAVFMVWALERAGAGGVTDGAVK